MSTNTVSKAHFSRMCGVSKPAITKAVRTGMIGMIDGNVNLDHRLTKEYYNSKPNRKALKPPDPKKKKPQKKKSARKIPVKPKTKEEVEAVVGSSSDSSPPSDESLMPDGIKCLDDIDGSNIHLISKTQIEILSKFETALSTRQKRDESRGLLIPRKTVKYVFAKLYTVDNNELKAMEERMAPAICGIFGEQADTKEFVEVRKLLNSEVIKALRHIKRIMNDFLVNIDI